MKFIKSALVLAVTGLFLTSLPLTAQQARVSPHETISATVDGGRITITYGRPYTKAPRTGEIRQIWGGLVPYGKVDRLGADESTLFITQLPLEMGGVTIPAGAYSLFSLPQENAPTQLIISKQLGGWGAYQYNPEHDLARINLNKETLAQSVDQFTIAIERNPAGGGILKFSWENTQFSVPFTVRK